MAAFLPGSVFASDSSDRPRSRAPIGRQLKRELSVFARCTHEPAVLSGTSAIYTAMEAHMDLQQLELECPFCGENQPPETARWDENGSGYISICHTCGKVFSGLALISADSEVIEWASPQRAVH
jgi:hypothetical protein